MSSVSGGSIANGLLAANYRQLEERGFTAEALDELIIKPFIGRVSTRSLTTKLLVNMWRALGIRSRTDVLAWALDRWFFSGLLLEELPNQVRWTFNAANVTTGVRFGFETDTLGDYVIGLAPTAGSEIRVAHAVAASAAVPGFFAPYRINSVRFPCQGDGEVKLLDGGVYDNMGLEVVDSLCDPHDRAKDPMGAHDVYRQCHAPEDSIVVIEY